jgi:hypothetical protein
MRIISRVLTGAAILFALSTSMPSSASGQSTAMAQQPAGECGDCWIEVTPDYGQAVCGIVIGNGFRNCWSNGQYCVAYGDRCYGTWAWGVGDIAPDGSQFALGLPTSGSGRCATLPGVGVQAVAAESVKDDPPPSITI